MTGSYRIFVGDVMTRLAALPDASVQCCVTSPPYYGLRDYQTATWEGGDDACDHSPPNDAPNGNKGQPQTHAGRHAGDCRKCGAKRIDQQIGLEPTPEQYVAKLVAVFREVRRVLRDDGICFINIGDSYASNWSSQRDKGGGGLKNDAPQKRWTRLPEHKPKDLIGVPWRVAFALQADGWWLRQDIIWHKPNPMPESVTDRCTKAHEYVFLLAKRERYFYDAGAVAEPSAYPGDERHLRLDIRKKVDPMCSDGGSRSRTGKPTSDTRNRRSVWTIPTQPYADAHFATMPPRLAELCVLAATSEHGCCEKCGAPWERVVEGAMTNHDGATKSRYETGTTANRLALLRQAARERGREYANSRRTIGWRSGCECNAGVVPCTVLDPFAGSGTTLMVACQHGRDAIGIELNPAYAEMAHDRIGKALRPSTHVSVRQKPNDGLFAGVVE